MGVSRLLNVASLLLGLGGALLAAYPSISPFHGKQLRDFTVDVVALQKTPEFERWEARNDMLARWGLFCVALSAAAGATAQLADRKTLVKTPGSGAVTP